MLNTQKQKYIVLEFPYSILELQQIIEEVLLPEGWTSICGSGIFGFALLQMLDSQNSQMQPEPIQATSGRFSDPLRGL